MEMDFTKNTEARSPMIVEKIVKVLVGLGVPQDLVEQVKKHIEGGGEEESKEEDDKEGGEEGCGEMEMEDSTEKPDESSLKDSLSKRGIQFIGVYKK